MPARNNLSSLLLQPPKVKCSTKLWHPNISTNGDICLSLLRQNSIDGLGWAPTRTLKDVIWGLNSLFTVMCNFSVIRQSKVLIKASLSFQDLLNFDDPLNNEAADQYLKDKREFQSKVREYITTYCYR